MSHSSGNRFNLIKLQDNDTINFLELYSAERLLFDPCCKEYKDRDLRLAAAKRVSEAMKIPGFGPKEVIAKFKNLRSSYCQELKKIADSEKSGAGADDVYIPKVCWFDLMNSFIRPFVQQRPTKSNLVIQTNSSNPVSPEEIPQQENATDAPSTATADTINTAQTPTTSKRKAPPELLSSNKVKKTSLDPQVAYMCGAIEKLDEISNRAALLPKEDSYDYFGKYIASMLRTIGPPTAMRLQEEITRMITQAVCPPPPTTWGQLTSNDTTPIMSDYSDDLF